MTLAEIAADVVACARCPRLVAHRSAVAQKKKRAHRDEIYWGRAVPGFGDPAARLLIVGLAPAAHGANRTGRMFTGDRSGDWLYRALYRAGFALQPTATHAGDGLELVDAYLTASARCAPPDNRPTRDELNACFSFLEREWRALERVNTVVALGQVAFETCLKLAKTVGGDIRTAGGGRKPRFAHGARYRVPGFGLLIASYHPSQQNTQTGRLTEAMLDAVFAAARANVDNPAA
ncbi:MAG TPA: uracil-DNA glycosylase [Limnochordia bacterium]